MKQLLQVNKEIWASVKHYATINETNLNEAVEQLLKLAIKNLKNDNNEGVRNRNARS